MYFHTLKRLIHKAPRATLSAAAITATAIATAWSVDEAAGDGNSRPVNNNNAWGQPIASTLSTLFSSFMTAHAASPPSASSPASMPADTTARSDTTTPPTSTPAAAETDVPLPTDKLSCKLRAAPPRRPVVLVSCGSFNPPTVMHLRMVDLAAEELTRRGYDVWGAYLSPVADAYGKVGLAPASDRIAMCRLAASAASASTTTEEPATVVASPADAIAAAQGAGRPVTSIASASSPGLGAGGEPTAPGGATVAAAASDEVRTRRVHVDLEPDYVMVYDWEARQPGYTRTLAVLRRVESELRRWISCQAVVPGPGSGQGLGPESELGRRLQQQQPQQQQPSEPGCTLQPEQQEQQQDVRAMLLCGGDVLASMTVPGVWRDPDVILRNHGVVCVEREGTDLERLVNQPGNVLYEHRDRIVIVYDRVGNSISSSKVRQELAAGRPVRYLVPRGVLSYIYERGLYGAGTAWRAESG